MTQNKKQVEAFATKLAYLKEEEEVQSATVYHFRKMENGEMVYIVEALIIRSNVDSTLYDYQLGTYKSDRGAAAFTNKIADTYGVKNEAHLIDMELGDDELEEELQRLGGTTAKEHCGITGNENIKELAQELDEMATDVESSLQLEELRSDLEELGNDMDSIDEAITQLDTKLAQVKQDTIQVEMDRFARDAEEAFNNGADLIETCVELHRNIYTAFSIIHLGDTIARYDYGEVTEEQCNHILLKLGKYDFNRLETITLEDLPALIRLKAMGQKYIYIVWDAQYEENRFLLSPQGMQDMAINLYDDIEESEGFNEADCIEVLNVSEYPVTYIEMAYGQPCTPLELQRLYDKREAGSYYTYDAEDKEYIGMVIFASGYLEERFKRFEDLQLWLKDNAK